MEGKLDKLEERLTMLERFVEMRFCESFRDFKSRNNGENRTADQLNLGLSREELITEVLQRLEGAGQRPILASEANMNCPSSPPPAPPPQPSSQVQIPGSRTSSRIAARKLNSANAKATPSKVTVKLVRIQVPPRLPPAEADKEPVKICPESDDPVHSEEDSDDYFSYSGEGAPNHDNFEVIPYSDKPPSKPSSSRKCKPMGGCKRTPLNLEKIELTPETISSLLDKSVLSRDDITSAPDSTQCQICWKFCSQDRFDQHMLSHTRERTAKCTFCDKMFFSHVVRRKHERVHQLDKFGLKCRLPSCSKVFTEASKQLQHERTCIRRALERGIEVDPELMADVRKRSTCKEEDFRWPTRPGEKVEKKDALGRGKMGNKGKYCAQCRIYIKTGFNEHHRQFHSRWRCPLCPEEDGRKYTTRQRLISHMTKFHNKQGTQEEVEAEAIAKQDGQGT